MFWGNEQFDFFEHILFKALGQPVDVIDTQFLSGGDINTAARIFSSEGMFFVKWNHAEEPDLFECEVQGLEALRQTGTLTIPRVIDVGQHLDKSYLILEYIDSALGKPTYWPELGRQLARIHAHTQPVFGFLQDNYIGTLIQNNTPMDNGIDFFFERRLLPMAGLAMYNQLLSKPMYDRFFRLKDLLPDILPDERPALIHGDLWSGNVMIDAEGHPALIDPAVFYGLREAEIAFTKLFGGFDERFYASYQEMFPLAGGFDERVPVYNLYPLLVHLNLFGTGYLSGVEKVLKRFT
ncbi:fructosamine kinase family protein [Arsenicibacter rosenii]|uniref:Ketosamine-3-kinase n=1 Tax=Arsenicibacter rosenii TaxID=1750698 RepID=A0A1S2VHR2_9BACT|nr:fructosamine kinase family protein [Arsenicibacter rosenii]OIN57950.1 ketosamine-3-kinase [Arsenicibacter rosenii]